ncbi:hypothetical protein D3C81_1976790 [compost metagenome]
MVARWQRVHGTCRAVRIAPGQHDTGADIGQRPARGEADAASAADNHGNLAGERGRSHGLVMSGRGLDRQSMGGFGKVCSPGSSAKSNAMV